MTIDDKIIRKISARYQISEEQVENLVRYSWGLVQRCMNDDRMPEVYMQGLGRFHVKPTYLKKLLNAMDRPDYKYRHTPDFEEYKKRVKSIYIRRLKENYLDPRVKNIPSSLREDVIKIRKECSTDMK